MFRLAAVVSVLSADRGLGASVGGCAVLGVLSSLSSPYHHPMLFDFQPCKLDYLDLDQLDWIEWVWWRGLWCRLSVHT